MEKLSAREAAYMRMAMHDEMHNLETGGMNTSTAFGAEYPRMLYRPTETEDRRVQTWKNDGTEKEAIIANKFDGLLCETVIANDADEAEILAGDGWDTTPQAAHGLVGGLVKATTAKDDEIAALRAELAEKNALMVVKRGPGRPPKEAEAS